MSALSEDERPSELVAAARAFLDEPSDEHRTRLVRAMTYPLGRTDMPDEVAGLTAAIRRVLDGDVEPCDVDNTLQTIAWYDMKLRPTGRLRVVDDDWQGDTYDDDPETAGLLTERPAPVDQFELDVEYQVRRLRISDEARTRYNAERNAGSEPEAMDVAAVIRGDYQPLTPTMLTRSDGQSLIYPGLLHWVYGPPGLGKTWVALYAAAQCMSMGGHVAYFDWEGNAGIVGERLATLDVSADVAAKQFHYYRPGNLEPRTDWLAANAAAEWHLAVIDGVAKALVSSGRKENDNDDNLAWLHAIATPLNDNGCAMVMLDHVAKDPENRGMPRGAGAKMGEVSGAAWEVRAGQPFNRRTAGYLRMVQRKDREGRTGIDGEVVAELHVRPTRGRTTFTLEPPARSAADLARARLMERAYDAVVSWTDANHGQWPSTSKVGSITGGHKGDLASVLDELADLGHLACHKGGPGKPTTWEPVTPYRAPVAEPAPGVLNAPEIPWDVAGGE